MKVQFYQLSSFYISLPTLFYSSISKKWSYKILLVSALYSSDGITILSDRLFCIAILIYLLFIHLDPASLTLNNMYLHFNFSSVF